MLEPEAVAEPAEGQKEAAIRVFLIRHGESESNAGLASATPDSAALTARGRWQAEQVARVIADDPALIKPQVEAYWVQADPGDRRGNGAESFTDLLGRSSDCLSRLSAQASGPVVVFTHGLFMRAVAWSLLTGVTMPGHEEMRAFRHFGDRYLIPNAGVIELRCGACEPPALMGAAAIHLRGAHAPWSQ